MTPPTRRAVMAGAVALAGCGPNVQEQGMGSSSPGPVRRVLWAANVRTKTFEERLRAALVGEFTHMSIFPIDFRAWERSGLSGRQIRRRLRDAGVAIHVVDPFTQWVPDFTIPDGYPPENLSFVDFDEAEIFRIAEEVEAIAVNCVEGLAQRHDQTALEDAFAGFAERAGRRGLRVSIEFMPISSIPDLAAGWRLVEASGRETAGLTFDTWHYFRSRPDFDLLRSLPGARIFEVQLADAPLALEGADLIDDLLRFRRFAGEGEFDLAPVIDELKRKGAWRSVGPELFSDAMDALDAEEVGRRAAANLSAWSTPER